MEYGGDRDLEWSKRGEEHHDYHPSMVNIGKKEA